MKFVIAAVSILVLVVASGAIVLVGSGVTTGLQVLK